MSKSKQAAMAMIPIGIALSFNALAQVQTELCTGIDGSGSISSTQFALQKAGLADAIADPTVVPQNGTVAIAVVQFASGAQVEVSRTVIDSAATASTVAGVVNGISQTGGGTRIDLAIDVCAAALTNAPAIRSVIDISTDGVSSGTPSASADAAIAAGLDALNAIGVGTGVSESGLQEFVRPQPATAAPPYDDGFYILVTDFAAYSAAIAEKIVAEIQPPGPNPQPIPAIGGIGLGVLAMLLATFGFRRLRGRGR